MTIPLKKEPNWMAKEFGVVERCVFCGNHTKMWHIKTSNPVCKICAKKHKVCELIDIED